jgi:hypothetical protein
VNDELQLQYYKYITKVMPGMVLRSHGVVTAAGEEFMLNLRVKLTPEQIRDLVRLCDTRILQYEQRYGKKSYVAQQVFACAKVSPGLCSTRC